MSSRIFPRTWTPRTWLTIILLSQVLAGVIYASVVIPPWEAHDEWPHFRYAAYIAENHHLPNPKEHKLKVFTHNDEDTQPPLYYMLVSVPLLLTDTEDGYQPLPNPFINDRTTQNGANVVVHNPEAEKFPWHGSILALHVARLVSVLLSLLAVYVTYLIVLYITPHRPDIALTAAALHAFAPEFLFIGSVVTNDILVALLGELLLYLSLRLMVEGPRPRLTIYAGLTAAAAILTKYSSLAMIPPLILAFLWGLWLHRHEISKRQLTRSALILFGALALGSGLLMGRNLQKTGKLIPRYSAYPKVVWNLITQGNNQFRLEQLPNTLRSGFITYWGSFGWANISANVWVYRIWLGLVLVGMIGIILWLMRNRDDRGRRLGIFMLIFAASVVGLVLSVELVRKTAELRGRLILSTLPVTTWTIAQGWEFITRRLWKWVRWGLVAWPVGLSIMLPITLIGPAYAPPERLAAPPQADMIPIMAHFGEYATLISARVEPADEVQVNHGLAVTLVWQTHARTDRAYAMNIQLVGPGNQVYGGVTTYPGYGKYTSNVWPTGIVFQETYWFEVQQKEPLPASGQILVNLFHEDGSKKKKKIQFLDITDISGQSIGKNVYFGSLRISPATAASPAESIKPLATFGPNLALTAIELPTSLVQAGETIPVNLSWQALGPEENDLKLSLQLLDEQGQWRAGLDGSISDVLLPKHWRAGDVLETQWALPIPSDLPAGKYRLVAVIYHGKDMARLKARDAQGNLLPDAILPLAEIEVK